MSGARNIHSAKSSGYTQTAFIRFIMISTNLHDAQMASFMAYRSEVRMVDQYVQKLEKTVRSDQEVSNLNHINGHFPFSM